MTLPGDIRNLIRRLRPERRLRVGDIWWVENHILKIRDSKTEVHPVLIARQMSKQGGYVGILPGSSTRIPQPGASILIVKPADCQEGTMIKPETRFWIGEFQPLAPEKLVRWQGRINSQKIEELSLRLRTI